MRKIFYAVLIITAAVLVLNACAPKPAPSSFKEVEDRFKGQDFIEVTLYHTNDIHGRMFRDEDEKSGSFAALAHYLKEARKEGGNIVVVDAGDYFQGTAEANYSRGKVIIDLFNESGYDIVVPGNHEIDYGKDVIVENAQRFKGKMLGVVSPLDDAELAAALEPGALMEFNGIKIGFIGISNLFNLSQSLIHQEIHSLRGQGAHIIVAVTHLGLANDQEIAAMFPIDVIIGGHTHTLLDFPYIGKDFDAYIVQAGAHLRNLGKTKIYIGEKSKKIEKVDYEIISIYDMEKRDEAAVKIKQRYFEKVSSVVDVELGRVPFDITRHSPDGSSNSLLGNFFCDIIRERYQTDIAFLNKTGIRGNIPAGSITLRDLIQAYPFENKVAVFNISGARIYSLFRTSAARFEFSGLKTRRSSGTFEITVNGKPLDTGKSYSVATSDFYADFLKGQMPDINVSYRDNLRDVVAGYIKEKKTINFNYEPRIF